MLFIEYDVTSDGDIELVALINAVEEHSQDPDGEAWLAWRVAYEDEGMGCVGVPPADLKAMEAAEDPEEFEPSLKESSSLTVCAKKRWLHEHHQVTALPLR